FKLIYEKAVGEDNWSYMYVHPRLCHEMMVMFSPKVQDDGIKNAKEESIPGGQLFCKYLFNWCQEDFEHGWVAKEAMALTKRSGNESEPYSDEYYVVQKAKCQSLGLIKFTGELFKLRMLTERIMHECLKRLLGNMVTPEDV
ncbi:armadillo-type protein, partial [Pisolithus albus]